MADKGDAWEKELNDDKQHPGISARRNLTHAHDRARGIGRGRMGFKNGQGENDSREACACVEEPLLVVCDRGCETVGPGINLGEMCIVIVICLTLHSRESILVATGPFPLLTKE
jgi:hypothetical protein